MDDLHQPAWDVAVAPRGTAPGVGTMLGYRGVDIPEAVHRGLPSSRLTFIVSLDDGVEATAARSGLDTARPLPILLSGLSTSSSYIRQRRGQAGVQLSVHPLAARALFGVPSAQLSVDDFDGVAVLGDTVGRRLHEQVTDSRSWDEAFDRIGAELTTRWRRSEQRRPAPPRPEVIQAWQLLERSAGRIPVSTVAAAVGLTSRHLSTLFDREFGRSPKTVARLMRFEAVTTKLTLRVRDGRIGALDLAHLAADVGFSDQAHLTREFTQLAGLPPTAWLAQEFRNVQDVGSVARAG